MLRGVYYNEIDPFCCDVLRARIADGGLPDGEVDERSIADVQPDDVRGFAQCHFFAGIGGFGLAQRLSGWPDDLQLWTGGFPCQDISTAGKGAGLAGERSGLWWEFFRLIDACRPSRLLIENVPALRTRGADDVLAALEGINYACWPLVVGAWAVGAKHRRDRVWIAADRDIERLRGDGPRPPAEAAGTVQEDGPQRQWLRANHQPSGAPARGGEMADAALSTGSRQRKRDGVGMLKQGPKGGSGCHPWPAGPGEPQHGWEAPRLVEFPMGGTVDGLPARLVRRANKQQLKAYGNAIVPWVAAAVMRSVMKSEGISP